MLLRLRPRHSRGLGHAKLMAMLKRPRRSHCHRRRLYAFLEKASGPFSRVVAARSPIDPGQAQKVYRNPDHQASKSELDDAIGQPRQNVQTELRTQNSRATEDQALLVEDAVGKSMVDRGREGRNRHNSEAVAHCFLDAAIEEQELQGHHDHPPANAKEPR